MKYFKPTSLTWWMSFLPIAGGIIKRTGQYEASVRFHRDVISTFTFDVVAQASK